MKKILTIRSLNPVSVLLLTTCVAVALVGCRRGGDDHSHEDHPQGEEPKTAQITVWGERHEIFAEHRFVVADTPTKFVTHVTDLKTLEPRREGPIKFALRQGNEAPIAQVENATIRAGVYEVMLKFPKAGDWNVSVSIPTEEGEKTVALPPVKVFASAGDAQPGDEPAALEGISFLKEQQWKILLKAEPVMKRRLVERVKLPATAMAKPGLSASVVAPVAGQLLAPTGGELPLPGQKVEAGQLLAVLRPSFSEAAAMFAGSEGEFARAKAAFDKAELTYQRTKKLADQNAKSERELQEAELSLQTARASYEAAAAFRSTYRQLSDPNRGTPPKEPDSFAALELRAPIAGVINQLGAGLGQPIRADHIVFQILNPEVLWIEARVPEAALVRIPENADASFAASGGDLVSIKAAGGGRVFAGLEVDAATRTVPLVYEAKNGNRKVRVGQAVSLYVETHRAEEAVAIPDSAIVEEAGNFIAFVQVSGETFQKRELKLGIRDGNLVQVLDGVNEGERVVTKGAMAIRLASVSGVIPAHGHAH
ncbi:MAG: efflux RND transporter periplasmic adaptor subunit [Verrucomicrobiales bacterium]|nr:efflux RND transporter periplasmic adaptor subunit [Verrucomicrobiales bacterium]